MTPSDIEQQLIEINDNLRLLSDKQNAQFTELMLEIKKLAEQIATNQEYEDGDDQSEDDLFDQAREAVIKTGKASTALLQRKLGVGYGRAARLIDLLEQAGVVGPANGASPREVLIDPDE